MFIEHESKKYIEKNKVNGTNLLRKMWKKLSGFKKEEEKGASLNTCIT